MNEVVQNLENISCPTTKAKHKPYPVYCNSGIEWLGDMPEAWEIKRLKYVVTCNDDILNELNDDEYMIQYVDISSVDLIEGIQKTEELKFSEAPSRARRKVRNGDTIISTVRTYLKAISFIDNPPNNLIVSTGFAVIRPAPQLDPKYLTYYLQSQGFVEVVVANSVGVSYPAINPSMVITLPILFPKTISDQKSIADFLDEKTAKIDALVEKKQRLIELLKEKRTALISHAVTKGLDPNAKMKASRVGLFGNMPDHWKEKGFGYLVSFNKGLNITKENLQDDGIPCISYGEIHSKYGFEVNPEKDELKCVSATYVESSKNALLRHGDFIFADTSEDVEGSGNFTYYNSNVTAFAGYHTILAKPTSDNKSRYLAYLFDSRSFRAQIQKEVTGTKVFSITNSILKDAVVLLPPIPEQQAIVSYLDKETSQIDVLVNKVKIAIDKLKEYRIALISAAVTGKIDVRGYDNNGGVTSEKHIENEVQS